MWKDFSRMVRQISDWDHFRDIPFESAKANVVRHVHCIRDLLNIFNVSSKELKAKFRPEYGYLISSSRKKLAN